MTSAERNEQMIQYYKSRNQHTGAVNYPVLFEQQNDGSWVAGARNLSTLGVYSFLTNGQTLDEVRKFAGYELYKLSAILGPVAGPLMEGEELIEVVEEPSKELCKLVDDIFNLQSKFDNLQKENDNLQLELAQYKSRYENANKMQVAAQLQFAELVDQGVLKLVNGGYVPAMSREDIDEVVFMCKIRANRMAEALHKYKYQKNNAYATDKDRDDAETAYMSALQLFNEAFVSL